MRAIDLNHSDQSDSDFVKSRRLTSIFCFNIRSATTYEKAELLKAGELS